MNLANMAAGRAPWIGPEPLVPSADLSLQLGFAWPALVEAPPAAPPTAWSWTSEPRDSARHGAELAALLVSLQPVESDFLPLDVPPLLAEAAPPVLEERPPQPAMPPPMDIRGIEPWMAPPPARLPPPEWLML